MLHRRFGRTEIQMPVLSCGGMRYQHKWQDLPLDQIPAANQQNLEATIQRAFELGIHHVETARGYGSSERQLGLVLPTLPRERLIAQTKIAPTEDPQEFIRHFEESLERMQLPSVDLLSVHGVNDRQMVDWTLRSGGCFEAAQSLRKRGLCRFVGVSTHARLEEILELVEYGRPEVGAGFDYINLHYYLVFQRNWPAILAAAARDMGVFIISPTDKGGRLFDPPKELVELCAPHSPIVVNDLFCLSHPEIHTLSIGAARPSDFDEHLKVLPLLQAADSVLAPTLERLADAMERATGTRDPELHGRGLPPHDQTPGGLHLETILRLRNLALGWGLVGYGKSRFNLMGSAGHWFPGSRASVIPTISDAELRAAVDGSPFAEQIPGWVREAWQLLGGEATKRDSQG